MRGERCFQEKRAFKVAGYESFHCQLDTLHNTGFVWNKESKTQKHGQGTKGQHNKVQNILLLANLHDRY